MKKKKKSATFNDQQTQQPRESNKKGKAGSERCEMRDVQKSGLPGREK